MDSNNYWTRRLRRRRFVQGAGVGATGLATLVLVGCGDDDDDDDVDPTATTAAGETPSASPTTVAGGPTFGGISVTQSANVYETVDPHRTVASPVLQVLSRVQSKLLRFSNPDTGDVVGDVIEEWETPDAQTVVLKLREGITWHSQGPGASNPLAAGGRALTTEDIQYNIERQKAGLLADGTAGSFGRKSYWNKVASIDIAGQAITLNLASPDATFVQGLANEFNMLVQRELIEAVEPNAVEISADKVIGTGANILTEWVPGETISAVKNPDYFLPDRPYLDGSRWIQTFEDPTAYRIAFEQKQTDYFTDPDPSVVLAIKEANDDSTTVRYSGVANTVAIYLPYATPPWNNLDLVKAIHLAADRRQLIQQLHAGLGKVSGPVSWLQELWAIPDTELETTPGYRVDKEADLTEARALWEAGGGPALGEITWVIADTWSQRAGWGSTPEIIAEMFNKAFGTSQFKAATKSYGEIIPAWFSKNFDPFFAWIPNVEIPDARADMVGAFLSTSPGNIWGINEPELVDAKLSKALTLLDYEEAYELLREVQDLAIENGQWGRIIMYNYIFPGLNWNYWHPSAKSDTEGWNLLPYSLGTHEDWLDSNDPTIEGRAGPSVKPL
jgi:peptide/nickel transport system substrate-binding protein/oligopeptide transport system substrate-binding protein